jgi:O-antigen/teichoic acid export membrane protein
MLLISKILNNPFIRSSFYSLLGGILSKGFSLIGIILVARNLGKETFGEIGVITSTLLLLAPFCSLGISYSANKIISQEVDDPIRSNTVIGVSLISTIVFSLIGWALIVFGFWVVVSFYSSAAIELSSNIDYILIFLVGFYLFLLINVNTLIGLYTGLNRLKSLVAYQGISGFFSIPLYYYMSLHMGIHGAFSAFVLTQLSLFTFLVYGIRGEIYTYLKRSLSDFFPCLQNILRLGVPLGLSDGVYAVTNWLLIILLLNRGGIGEVGLFNAAIQWLMIIVFLPTNMSSVLLAYLSKLALSNQLNHRKLFKYNLVAVFIFSSIFSIFFIVYSDSISKIYGDDFSGISEVISILILSAVPITITNVFFQGYISHNKPKLVFVFRVISQGILILLTYYFLSDIDSAFHFSIYRLISSTVVLILIGFAYYIYYD